MTAWQKTPITASGVVSAAGDDYVIGGMALLLTTVGHNDYASVRFYDGTDATGVLLLCEEVWQEANEHHRTHTQIDGSGVVGSSGLYAEVVTESDATFKCSLFYN